MGFSCFPSTLVAAADKLGVSQLWFLICLIGLILAQFRPAN
jgi:hypothetical protein